MLSFKWLWNLEEVQILEPTFHLKGKFSAAHISRINCPLMGIDPCHFAYDNHPLRAQAHLLKKLGNMGHDSISSPAHRRSQNPVSPLSASFRRQSQSRYDFDGWVALFRRHQFLLTMLAILTLLCTIYLYFAVTLGAAKSCSGLSGTQKALCRLGQVKSSMPRKGKLRFF